ncbi:hydantoinase/oxoprolinase family protein [Janibacter anophelis]|uniref:hydantoinase/oxoprolinase family protein n=1 Tax=Janibacter anophelis TaxID=319054 RepID=UPI000833AD1E|nr:hydantoinase/oxoprolinase family protein [Janibacter anophelis]
MTQATSTAARRIGIDIGGTFTDLFVVEADGTSRIFKSPTTPHDPSEGLLNGLGRAAESFGQSLTDFLGEVSTIVHGTTIATNAVLTRQGAKTGFVTTRGFRDLLNMRRGIREHQNNSKYAPPTPLVPRDLIATVRERTDVNGDQITPLVEEDVRDAARLFREQGVEAVAVSYLWSFLNPEHEQRTAQILREELPGVFVTISSDVVPQIRAYERHSTTVLNAFVGPKLQTYLANIKQQLSDRGFGGSLLIVQSNGGVMSPEIASESAVNALMSGPAAAPEAALQFASAHGSDNVITVDMGGTSFDVALIRDGQPLLTNESEIGGYRVALPMLDIHTVGAGGGSLVWVDSGGIMRVGPQSATANPGPACYGRGGENPTTTDADLLMGYLNPDSFGDGAFRLDVEAARTAVEEKVAKPLGLSVPEAISGISRVVNATMAEAVSAVSVKRGVDPREFTMVVAGGAGPIHAVPIAQDLGIGRIIVPRDSSVFCAVGTLLTDLKHLYARTFVSDIDSLDLDQVSELYRDMRQEALDTLQSENVAPQDVDLVFSADIRYIGQFTEIEIPVRFDGELTGVAVKQLVADFEERHEALNGYTMPGEGTELINVRLTALGRTVKPRLLDTPSAGPDPSAALTGRREAIFSGTSILTDVFDGLALQRDNRVVGPAIIEQPTTTVVLTEGHELTVDAQGNYVIEPLELAASQ